jgi:hypothetical protein
MFSVYLNKILSVGILQRQMGSIKNKGWGSRATLGQLSKMVYGILFKNRIHFEPAPLIIQSLIA